ncbi:hypothetical protein DFP73DRAFT_595145 [Morchella snyderi]|nr:hypothetical protein DFP73DRAFT_595145 [Morchella snyderi]
MFTFYDNGDIKGPTDHLNSWTEQEWRRAYRLVPDLKENKKILEKLLDDTRIIVQGYSDLLFHPYRTSEISNEQDQYWDLYYHWYRHILLRSLIDINTGLKEFWKSEAAKSLHEHYKDLASQDILDRGSIEYQGWDILNYQIGSLTAYCKDLGSPENRIKVRRYLNSTGAGARIWSTDESTMVVLYNEAH